jgi:hypothetical protein
MAYLKQKISRCVLTVARLELEFVEQLNSRNQEGNSLSRSCLGSPEDIATSQQWRDGACLNFSHLCESNVDDSLLGGFAELKGRKVIVDLLAAYSLVVVNVGV